MMNIVKLQIDDQAPFHFGEAEGHLSDSFSSNQLFSAIANNIRLLYGPDKVKEFVSLPESDWAISSLFYGIDICPKGEENSNQTIYFLPRPKIDFRYNQEAYMSQKELKKVEYISTNLYKRLSQSWDGEKEAAILNPEDVLIISKKFALLKEETTSLDIAEHEWNSLSFLSVQVRPGVVVNRLHSKSDNYFTQEELIIHYEETRNYIFKPFMYFFLSKPSPTYVSAAIRLLADEGIGGKRSFGRGFFQNIEFLESPVNIDKDGRLFMTLSSYFPKKDEVHTLYSYELEKKNGFIYSQYGRTKRKKSILTVKEGSLLATKVEGEIIDIRPEDFSDHPVYFYGKPLLVGFGGEPS